MPVQYTGVLSEVQAVRQKVGLFDVSHMGRVRVHGRGAFDFLQRLVVSDVSALSPEGGAAQYSLLCLESGGILDDIIVYRLGRDEFLIVVNASNREKDLAWMRRHAGDCDVVIEDETDITALLAVQGPGAVALVDQLSDRDITMIPRFGVDETVVVNIQAVAARTGYTGEDGVELFCRASDAHRLWTALVDLGAVPCGLGARDTLRLEAALPLYGHEMDEHIIPFEARLSWVVKLEKEADFLGKQVLADLKTTPKRKVLVGLAMDDRGIPREGYLVMAGDEVVGHITSGTFSPTLGKGIGLARVKAAHGARGNRLDIVIRETRHPAQVVGLPFYKNV
jgi:aminomethyltransferase